MTSNGSFEITKDFPVLGKSGGRIYSMLSVNKEDWYLTVGARYPSDLRFKAPLIKLNEEEFFNLYNFLKKMIEKISELKGVIPENKLHEDEAWFQSLLINYMIFRNKTKISFYFHYRSGINVILDEDEIRIMLKIFEEIPATIKNMRSALQ